MQHVQDNAEAAVRKVIDVLKDGEFAYEMDNGAVVRVTIRIDAQRARSHHRLHRHQRAAAGQLQRAAAGDRAPRCCTCSARWWTTRSR